MSLKPTTAANFRPLVYSIALVDGEKSINLDGTEYSWKLSEDASKSRDEKDAVAYFGVRDLMTIENVVSYTAIYGYSTYGPDAQPRLYRQVNPDTNQYEYEAYVTQSEGRALIIALDKNRVAKAALEIIAETSGGDQDPETSKTAKAYLAKLAKNGDTSDAYEWLVARTREQLDRGQGDSSGESIPLFTILHSIEHALTYEASLQTGLGDDAFVGKVLIADCAVMIYEQGHVEAGGVEYLYQDKLDVWLLEAIKHTRDCRYESREGCPRCLFIKDPLCHPFMPTELPIQYMFPNQLLSRYVLMKIWGIDAAFTEASPQGPTENGEAGIEDAPT